MTFEEFGAFFRGNARPAADRKAQLEQRASSAWAQGSRLAACHPERHELLLEAIVELKLAIRHLDVPWEEVAGRRVAHLAGYIHSMASTLYKHMIPSHETEAHSAAQQCDEAALWIVQAMEGEFGDLPAQ